MSDRLDFLNAAIAAHDGPYLFEVEGERQQVARNAVRAIAESAEQLRISPITADNKVCFFFRVLEEVEEDTWMGARLMPSMVLQKGDNLLLCWALEEPVDLSEEVEAFGLDFDEGFTEDAIPTPGTNGWGLVACDPDRAYPLDEFYRVYGNSEEAAEGKAEPAVVKDSPPEQLVSLGKYGDADIFAEFDENDPALAREIVVTLGASRDSVKWKPTKLPIGALIGKLCRHEEGKKDGLSVVLADMVPGQRKNNSIIAEYGVGLDIDTGMPAEQIDAAVKKLGIMAVRYTTHSNGTVSTSFSRDAVVKKTGETKITTEVMRDYLRKEHSWVPEILDSVKYETNEHTERGIQVVISHKPMAKNRLIVPFASPFIIADVADTQKKALDLWKEIPQGLADLLGGLPLDTACLEAARLFYMPRHPKGQEFSVSLFGGKLFDWQTLTAKSNLEKDLEKLTGGRKSGGPSTELGRKLGRWAMTSAHGFQIATAIEDHQPDRVRFEKAPGNLEIECPFDEDHSNPGDPEDRACFVVNAGDGAGDAFFARCRHDSCSDKNNLDMLGKMIADGWFGDEILADDSYNTALVEDAPNPEVAKRIVKEDEAKADYQEAIEPLTPTSDAGTIEKAIRLVLEAKLNPIEHKQALKMIQKAIKHTAVEMKSHIRYVMGLIKEADDDKDGKTKSKFNHLVYEYEGEPHFHEASGICLEELINASRDPKDKKTWLEPQFSCLDERLMRMQWNRAKTRVSFTQLDATSTWAELSDRVAFVRVSDGVQSKPQKVPEDIAKHVFVTAYRTLPQTPEVLYTPCFTSAGKLITEPMWYTDGDDNIFLVDTGLQVDPISDEPEIEEVEEAVDWLVNDLMVDFAFLDHDLEGNERVEPSRANALAMLITPFMRRMIKGVTPVFFVTKPMPGTGGTLLGSMPMLIFDGDNGMPLAYSMAEDEMRKILVSAIMETRTSLFFDDVKDFNNRTLLQSITAPSIGGRILGSSKNVERPNNYIWGATGNNPHILSEMARRICWIRLNAKTGDINQRKFTERYRTGEDGKPERIEFNNWVLETRGKTVWAILTLIQHWIASGSVPFTARYLTTFEEWGKKVGGVLQAAGIEGFLDNRRVINVDQDESAIRQFVVEWSKSVDSQHGRPMHLKALLDLAALNELDILEGNNDDQKKSRFLKIARTLPGRVFKIGKVDYMVHETLDDEDNYALILKLNDPEPAIIAAE